MIYLDVNEKLIIEDTPASELVEVELPDSDLTLELANTQDLDPSFWI